MGFYIIFPIFFILAILDHKKITLNELFNDLFNMFLEGTLNKVDNLRIIMKDNNITQIYYIQIRFLWVWFNFDYNIDSKIIFDLYQDLIEMVNTKNKKIKPVITIINPKDLKTNQ